MTNFYKTPRLFVDCTLKEAQNVFLDHKQIHYLRSVLRQQAGDHIRLFNGREGEWLCTLSDMEKKKGTARPMELLRPQTEAQKKQHHLLFAPLKKKAAMDFLIEKAVELGVTALHPVVTEYTQVHQLKEERLTAQIIEAAEQCERLDLPSLFPLMSLEKKIETWPDTRPVMACIERKNTEKLKATNDDTAFLVGPEGGFSEKEKEYLESKTYVKAVSLGKNILRAETACLTCLAISGT